MIDISIPPSRQLAQHTKMIRGRDAYQDTNGVNVQDGYFFADNGDLRSGKQEQHRTIQPGRGYNFTGTEYIFHDLPSIGDIAINVKGRYDSTATTGTVWRLESLNGVRTYICETLSTNKIRVRYWNGSSSITLVEEDISNGDLYELFASYNVTTGNHLIYLNEVKVYDAVNNMGIANFEELFIGIHRNLASNPLTGQIYSVELYEGYFDYNDKDQQQHFLVYNCDESAGLISYDASGNGNDGDITLGGSAESSFHITDNGVESVQNAWGYSKAGHFDGSRYKVISHSTDFDINNFEFNVRIVDDGSVDAARVYFHGHDITTAYGWRIDKKSGLYRCILFYGSGSNHSLTNPQVTSLHEIVDIKLRRFNDVMYLDVNGNEVTRASGFNPRYNGFDCQVGTNFGATTWTGVYYSLTVHELDQATGSRIKELINLDYTRGNETLVPNIATDAPADRDAIWTNGTGAYVLIPVDQSNPDQDVLGNVLPEEYTGQVRYDEQIKGSSVGNFDTILYGQIDYKAELRVNNFEIQIKCIPTRSGPYRFACNTTTSNTDGFELTQVDATTFGLITRGAGTSTLYSDSGDFDLNQLATYGAKFYGTTGEIYRDGVLLKSDGAMNPLTLTNNNNFVIGVIGALNAKWGGQMFVLEYYELDGSGNRIKELIKLNFSETNGLVWHNLAADAPANSNASVILDGSSDGTQWDVSELQYPKNLFEGFNKAGYFANRRALGYKFGVNTNDIVTFEFAATMPDTTSQQVFFTSDGGGAGRVEWYINNASQLYVGFNGQSNRYANDLVAGGTYKIKVEAHNSQSFTETLMFIDDVEQTRQFSASGTLSMQNTALYLGSNAGGGAPCDNVSMHYFKVDINGTEVIHYDFTGGDALTAPNVTDNPDPNSEMNWENSDGVYTLIPADPNNKGKDIYGDDLQILGRDRAANSAENTYDRNPMDAPELVAAGINQGEDIDYATITGDISRFYDSYEQNRLLSSLVYGDFVEPIAGSVGNFDGVLYGKIPHDESYRLLEPVFKTKINYVDYTANQHIFSAGKNGGGNRTGMNYNIINNDLRIGINYDNSATQWTEMGYNLVDGNTYEIEVWVDDTAQRVYAKVNGEQKDFAMIDSIRLTTSFYNMWIGAYDNDGVPYYFATGKFYYLSYGSATQELINLKFSEEKGLIWHNIAADRPSDSNASVILNGSSDGTQWLLDENKDYHHNLEWGFRAGSKFNYSNYYTIQPEATHKQTYFELEFKVQGRDVDDTLTFLEIGRRSGQQEGVQFINQSIQNNFLVNNFTTGGNVQYNLDSSFNDGDIHKVVYKVLNGQVKYTLDDGAEQTVPLANPILYNVDGVTAIGYSVGSGEPCYETLYYVKMWQIDGTTEARIVQVMDVDFLNKVDRISGLPLELTGVEELVKVPGDPNNYKKDVNGNDIDNADEVSKYRQISNYLRR